MSLFGTGAVADEQEDGYQCPPGLVLHANDLPERVPARCGLVGRTLVANEGVKLIVPPANYSMEWYGLGEAGRSQSSEFIVNTDADGGVHIEMTGGSRRPGNDSGDHKGHEGDEPAAISEDTSTLAGFTDETLMTESEWEALYAVAIDRPKACDDARFNDYGFKETDDFHWNFNASTAPNGLDLFITTDSMRYGMNGIEVSRNNCGTADTVDASNTYQGLTTRRSEMDAGGCHHATTTDGYNTVDFRYDVPDDKLAGTCAARYFGNLTHADVAFNKGRDWRNRIASSCSGAAYDIKSVMTHEAGHVFGLWHVANSNLTMTDLAFKCDTRLRTLGKGDIAF